MAGTVKPRLEIPNQDKNTINIDLDKYDASMKKIKNDLTNINKTLKAIKNVYKDLADDSKSKGKFKKSINGVVNGVQKKVNAHNTLKNSLENSLTRSISEYSIALNKKNISQMAKELVIKTDEPDICVYASPRADDGYDVVEPVEPDIPVDVEEPRDLVYASPTVDDSTEVEVDSDVTVDPDITNPDEIEIAPVVPTAPEILVGESEIPENVVYAAPDWPGWRNRNQTESSDSGYIQPKIDNVDPYSGGESGGNIGGGSTGGTTSGTVTGGKIGNASTNIFGSWLNKK